MSGNYVGRQPNPVVVLPAATQAEQEAGAAIDRTVTPGIQKFNPSAAKAWAIFDQNGTLAASFNVTNVVRNGVGNLTVNWAVPFSSANYLAIVGGDGGGGGIHCGVASRLAGSCNVRSWNTASQVPQDLPAYSVVAFGDLP